MLEQHRKRSSYRYESVVTYNENSVKATKIVSHNTENSFKYHLLFWVDIALLATSLLVLNFSVQPLNFVGVLAVWFNETQHMVY